MQNMRLDICFMLPVLFKFALGYSYPFVAVTSLTETICSNLSLSQNMILGINNKGFSSEYLNEKLDYSLPTNLTVSQSLNHTTCHGLKCTATISTLNHFLCLTYKI